VRPAAIGHRIPTQMAMTHAARQFKSMASSALSVVATMLILLSLLQPGVRLACAAGALLLAFITILRARRHHTRGVAAIATLVLAVGIFSYGLYNSLGLQRITDRLKLSATTDVGPLMLDDSSRSLSNAEDSAVGITPPASKAEIQANADRSEAERKARLAEAEAARLRAQQDQQKSAAIIIRANTLFEGSQFKEALDECQKALALDPHNDGARSLLTKITRTVEVLDGAPGR
jgi:hypothetical protein